MKQILVQKGNIIIEELPAPAISDNEILVKTHYSLVSTGTELAGISVSKQSLLTRALHQPHNVKKAIKMAGEKGILATYKLIKGMLDFGTPLGYSLAGEVIEVGKNITDIKIGDFVAASGAGIANHAEFVAVPRLLASKIPHGLNLRQAASVTLGAIAMQGVRQANPHFGETVAVIGLGLIGQLTIQILVASGIRVIGIDIDATRANLAKKLGADFGLLPQQISEIKQITDGFGVDATIITASTESNEPLNQAMEITRKKGTVVIVGAIGLNLQRSPWYEKEIDLKISCSYGPGRYDATYEEEMLDYPLPYVRWTLNRNMEEYLKLLSEEKIDFMALLPEEFPFEHAPKAYAALQENHPLAVLLKYGAEKLNKHEKIIVNAKKHDSDKKIGIALIGAGSFATITHLPNLEKLKNYFSLKAIVSKKGLTAKQLAKRYNADYCASDYEEVLKDTCVDAVLIATRHNLHAEMVLKALKAGKHVFVEKPLALNEKELNEIKKFYNPKPSTLNPKPLLFVGFNRRFSPCAKRAKELIINRKNPLLINYRMNAGYIPLDHWTQKPGGGGRIIGEACHIFDLFNFWTGSAPQKIQALSINPKTKDISSQDNFGALISYADGSVCNLIYTALGNKNLPKEYAEIYCDGKVLILDDYKKIEVKSGSGSLKTFTQDKGHLEELQAFAHGIQTGHFPIPLEELFSATEISFEVNKLATHG
ncbi:Gfo/Idh/MocA family oxidoreductase [Candidatus Peregrinibacteria bacterium]|nr:Gfo/Idh/MocA family oxidoreductase [Candidatus Peregrinibacteria bacterium]